MCVCVCVCVCYLLWITPELESDGNKSSLGVLVFALSFLLLYDLFLDMVLLEGVARYFLEGCFWLARSRCVVHCGGIYVPWTVGAFWVTGRDEQTSAHTNEKTTRNKTLPDVRTKRTSSTTWRILLSTGFFGSAGTSSTPYVAEREIENTDESRARSVKE